MSAKSVNTKLIAITGNICSGKTEFLTALKNQGHETVSSDEIVSKLWQNPEVLKKISTTFVLPELKNLKKIVKKTVFNNPKKLKQLEGILLPLVFLEIEKIQKNSKNTYIFVEVPLLFERKLRTKFDFAVLIYADLETCKSRFLSSRKGSEKEFFSILKHQIINDEKLLFADYVVYNNHMNLSLEAEISALFSVLKMNYGN